MSLVTFLATRLRRFQLDDRGKVTNDLDEVVGRADLMDPRRTTIHQAPRDGAVYLVAREAIYDLHGHAWTPADFTPRPDLRSTVFTTHFVVMVSDDVSELLVFSYPLERDTPIEPYRHWPLPLEPVISHPRLVTVPPTSEEGKQPDHFVLVVRPHSVIMWDVFDDEEKDPSGHWRFPPEEQVQQVAAHESHGVVIAVSAPARTGPLILHYYNHDLDPQPGMVLPIYDPQWWQDTPIHWHPTEPWVIVQTDRFYVLDMVHRQILFDQTEALPLAQWWHDAIWYERNGELYTQPWQRTFDVPNEQEEGNCLYRFAEQSQQISRALEDQRLTQQLVDRYAPLIEILTEQQQVCELGVYGEALLLFWALLRQYSTFLPLPTFTVAMIESEEINTPTIRFTSQFICAVVHAIDTGLEYVVCPFNLGGSCLHSVGLLLRRQYQDEVIAEHRTDPHVKKQSVWEYIVIDTSQASQQMGACVYEMNRALEYFGLAMEKASEFLSQYGWTLHYTQAPENRCTIRVQEHGTCTPSSGLVSLMLMVIPRDQTIQSRCRQLETYWQEMKRVDQDQAFDHLALHWFDLMVRWARRFLRLSDADQWQDRAWTLAHWPQRVQQMMTTTLQELDHQDQQLLREVYTFIQSLHALWSAQMVEGPESVAERVKRRRQ